MKVFVTSKNPVKILATKKGFSKVFPNRIIKIVCRRVDSGVSKQPVSDQQTLQGALNRTRVAMQLQSGFDYYVGIEGGVESNRGKMFSFAWVVARSGRKIGKARTLSFMIPRKAERMINKGEELGIVMDELFQKKNIKQKEGAIGLLTNNIIDRTSLYIPAVVCALIPFMKNDLFNE